MTRIRLLLALAALATLHTACNPVSVVTMAAIYADTLFDSGPAKFGPPASTDPPDAYGVEPSMEDGLLATVDGVEVPMPSLSTDVRAEVLGDWQDVHVTQVFANPHDVVVDARYVFPLPHDAAVYAMTMTVGDERIVARIDTVEQATQTFEAAAEAGNTAALLTQNRPNVFVQRLANIAAGESVTVEISYNAPVDRVDGAWEIAIPLVVGPRFDAPGTEPAAQPSQVVGVTTAQAVEPRVSVEVTLTPGLPIRHLSSRTHRIGEASDELDRTVVSLVEGRVPDNRDFVLRWEVGGDDVAVAQSHAWGSAQGGGYFALRVEPPTAIDPATVQRREMGFVLDTSGSMEGQPMELSRALVSSALRTLRPGDTFRIVRFGDDATEYSDAPIAATPSSIEDAIRYVDGLRGMGGTMMSLAVQQALSPPVPDESLRMVVFLTDGYIGNEAQIIAQIDAMRGDARLFAVGVGNGVHRWLLDEMGTSGSGFARFVDLDEQADDVVDELVARWETPVWTDVTIDWGGAPVSAVTPDEPGDLFAGHPLRVVGTYTEPGTYEVVVRGQQNGAMVEVPVTLELSDHHRDGWLTLGRLWARSRVTELTREHMRAQYAAGRIDDPDVVELQEQITALGLEWRLVTQWTAFVAVSERVVDPNGTSSEADVAVPMVDGVGLAAYGGAMGSSTPEPGTLLALATAALAGGAARRRRRRSCDDDDRGA